MEILEYKRFLSTLSLKDLEDYLYELDLRTLTDDERKELEFYLADMRVKKVLQYLSVFGFLTIALKGIDKFARLVAALGITKPEIPAPGEKPYDLVWVAQPDACDECAAEDGKIYGKTTDKIPGEAMHPHCMCEFVKVYREEMPKVKAMNIKRAPGGAVRAFQDGDKMVLEVLAAPFGSPTRKDRLGQYLSARTDFMIGIGDKRPTLYLHGYSPRRRAMEMPPVLGIAEVIRIDDAGYWMRTELDDIELSRRTWEAAKRGEARASTGSIAHLVRPRNKPDGSPTPGEVTVWAIAELSVFDGGDKRIPVSDDAIVIPLRALFEEHELEFDERFEAGEAENLTGRRSEMIILDDLEDEMPTEKEIQAAVASALKAERETLATAETARADMKKSILDELKADPQYRAIFNVNKIDDGVHLDAAAEKRGATKEMLQENFAYMRALIEAGKVVAEGGMPPPAFRVLEESEALELGPMVPTDVANRIHELRDETSLVRRSGMYTYQTDKLTFTVPTETTAMVAAATIAEEGAYVANETAFAAKPTTMLKKGSLVAVTEEALEDQDLFEQFLVRACGRSIGLAENVVLFGLIDAVAGVEMAATHAPSDAEILALYGRLKSPYRDGAVFIMHDDWMMHLLSILIATPRAYWTPSSWGSVGGAGDIERFMGKRLLTESSNWRDLTAADDEGVIDFINLSEAIAWVDRRGISIFVDPYSTRASAGTINYLPSARFNGVVVNAAAVARLDDHTA